MAPDVLVPDRLAFRCRRLGPQSLQLLGIDPVFEALMYGISIRLWVQPRHIVCGFRRLIRELLNLIEMLAHLFKLSAREDAHVFELQAWGCCAAIVMCFEADESAFVERVESRQARECR